MWIVLGNLEDPSALWAYQGLKARGLEPIEFVSGRALSCSLSWEHRVGNESPKFYSAFQLADGRLFTSREVRGVLNRLNHLPAEQFVVAKPADRLYASQEFTAFILSWLNSLSGLLINQPSPQGLAGRWRRPLEWQYLAAKAGLDVPGSSQNSFSERSPITESRRSIADPSRTVLVLNGEIYGADPPGLVRSGLAQLHQFTSHRLFGAYFSGGGDNGWIFQGATLVPDLRRGGDTFLEGLVRAMTQ